MQWKAVDELPGLSVGVEVSQKDSSLLVTVEASRQAQEVLRKAVERWCTFRHESLPLSFVMPNTPALIHLKSSHQRLLEVLYKQLEGAENAEAVREYYLPMGAVLERTYYMIPLVSVDAVIDALKAAATTASFEAGTLLRFVGECLNGVCNGA